MRYVECRYKRVCSPLLHFEHEVEQLRNHRVSRVREGEVHPEGLRASYISSTQSNCLTITGSLMYVKETFIQRGAIFLRSSCAPCHMLQLHQYAHHHVTGHSFYTMLMTTAGSGTAVVCRRNGLTAQAFLPGLSATEA